MKSNWLKKSLAIVLSLGLIAGHVPVYIAFAADGSSLILNSGFEEAASVGIIPGWEIQDGSGTIEVTTEAVHSGAQSLKIIDTGGTQSPFIWSSSVAVNPADKISASVYAAVSANDGNSTYVDGVFGIRFFDSNGGFITEKDAPDLTGNGDQ